MHDCHTVTARVEATADRIFEHLVNPQRLGRWNLGCMDLVAVGPGIYEGTSLFDGGRGCVSIDADRSRWLVDYHVGTLQQRVPRISARVVPGPVCGYGSDTCYVTLTAWRTAAMTDDRWARLCAAHEAEIWLIKSQMEAGPTG